MNNVCEIITSHCWQEEEQPEQWLKRSRWGSGEDGVWGYSCSLSGSPETCYAHKGNTWSTSIFAEPLFPLSSLLSAVLRPEGTGTMFTTWRDQKQRPKPLWCLWTSELRQPQKAGQIVPSKGRWVWLQSMGPRECCWLVTGRRKSKILADKHLLSPGRNLISVLSWGFIPFEACWGKVGTWKQSFLHWKLPFGKFSSLAWEAPHFSHKMQWHQNTKLFGNHPRTLLGTC